MGRRRGLEPGRGGQPADQPHRRRGRQLRLALLRGSRSPGQLRRGQPVAVRGALHERNALGAPISPTATPTRWSRASNAASAARRSPAWPSASTAAAPIPPPTTARCSSPTTRATASGCSRRRRHIAQRGREDDLRRARPEPGRSADLAQRRAVLRGLQRRHDPAHRLLGRQPAPGRRRLRRPDQRAATADRAVRRFDLRRPGLRCSAGLRLGPGRRRPVRRLDRRAAVLHVHAGGDLHRAATGHRRRRLERHRRRGHLRRQHSAHGHDLVTQPGPELEGRRHDLVRR